MRVLVTGGTGLVGRALIERLIAHGWDIRVNGIEPEFSTAGVEYAQCDILDFAAVREQVRGCQVIVHLAAIPNPRQFPGQQVFQVNVAGTFNLFEAAAQEGIKRVVQASSINAIGCAWGPVEIAPQYLPIDEAHPAVTTDPYSFSKQLIEDVGAYYWRRDGISSVAMRFPGVLPIARRESDQHVAGRRAMRAFLDEFAALPPDEQESRLDAVRKQTADFRGRRSMEYGAASVTYPHMEDLLWRAYAFDRFNYWAFVDERDSAQAMEKALLAEYEGSHPLFINSDHNSMNYDSATLARLFYPGTPTNARPLVGSESLVSIERARSLIGYAPEYGILP